MSQNGDKFHKATATLLIPGDHLILTLVDYSVM